jgi:hypothetical protein
LRRRSPAFICSVSALAISLKASRHGRTQELVYQRIVRDVAKELEPVYHDFKLAAPSDPATLRDALRPLIGIAATRTAAPRSTTQTAD